MKIRIELPAAVWPESREAAPVQAGLALPALAWLLGRASLTAATCQDKIARAPLLLADLMPQSESGYWLCADPVSLRLDNNSVTLLDAHHFSISQTESDALIAALNAQFSGDGLVFVAATPTLWFVRLPVEPAVQFTPFAQVCGRNIAAHLPQGSEASRWHQILNEMQMLLYTHPVNDARKARFLAPVNSFWISGTGTLPATPRPAPAQRLVLDNSLSEAALRDDAPAWAKAWQALDAGLIAKLLTRAKANEAMEITLCGERLAPTFVLQSSPWWNRLQRRFTAPPPHELLLTL